MNDMRWASIDAFVEENRDNILRDITRLVAVPSVEGAPEPGAPFGPGPKAALAKALEIADELGLDTFNADSYIGWAETGRIADGQKFLATITHTDVVPEGNGWDADPYTVRVRDGWLLGRGVADDKGPSILCLYALKYLKDSGAALKYPVRALLGANEETNMHDVDYYAEHYPMPAFCFTPDAEFPVCNGEKGGFNGELVSPKFENGIITAFEGGVAHNAVPDRASCTVQVGAGALVQTEGVTFEAGEGGATVIRGWGKSGHAAMPEGTVNAISLIVNCLLKSGVCTPQEEAYLQVLHTLHASTDGSALGIAADDGLFDPLTIIGRTNEMKDGIIRQSLRKFAGEFIDRKLTLHYEPLHLSVVTDEKWLGFVVEQVLSNALKYTPEGGSITIDAEAPATLCIRDTGIGITAEDLPRIFDRGYTGRNGRTYRQASGIGLYLCRRICRDLGHTITASSAAGEGTVLRLDLSRRTGPLE